MSDLSDIDDRCWRLWDRLDALEHPDDLSPAQRAIYVLHAVWGGGACLADYYNYGLTQFVTELPSAARFIGADDCATLLDQANRLFPDWALTPNGVITYLEDHLDGLRPQLRALDDAFEQLAASGQGLGDHIARYAREHPLEFPEFAA